MAKKNRWTLLWELDLEGSHWMANPNHSSHREVFLKGGNPMSRHDFAGFFGRFMWNQTGSAIPENKETFAKAVQKFWWKLGRTFIGSLGKRNLKHPETVMSLCGKSSILRSWGFLGFTTSCSDTQGTCWFRGFGLGSGYRILPLVKTHACPRGIWREWKEDMWQQSIVFSSRN